MANVGKWLHLILLDLDECRARKCPRNSRPERTLDAFLVIWRIDITSLVATVLSTHGKGHERAQDTPSYRTLVQQYRLHCHRQCVAQRANFASRIASAVVFDGPTLSHSVFIRIGGIPPSLTLAWHYYIRLHARGSL
jgi:hypothetical protein